MPRCTVFMLAAYVSGVLLAVRLSEWQWSAAAFALAWGCGAVGVIAAAGAWRHASVRGRETPVRLLLSAFGCAALFFGFARGGSAILETTRPSLRTWVLEHGSGRDPPVAVLEGRLVADAQATDFGAMFVLDVERVREAAASVPADGRVSVSVGGAFSGGGVAQWRQGRRVRAVVSLRDPQPYRNPGVPDQSRALALRGIAYLASAKSALLVHVLGRGSWFEEAAATVRGHVRAVVRRALMSRASGPPPVVEAGVLTAILIGDRAGIPRDVADRLQRAGTFHVIAISGGNIAILAVVLFAFMRMCQVPQRIDAIVVAMCLGGYWFIAGGTASVARATLVAVVYASARLADVRPRPFAVLSAAVLGLLVWSPLGVFDPGFLLTCAATAAILVAVQVSRRKPPPAGPASREARRSFVFWSRRSSLYASRRSGEEWLHRLAASGAGALRSMVVASIAADIALLPIAATVFSQVTLAGPILNLLALPAMAVAQICGLIVVGSDPLFPFVANASGALAAISVRALIDSARLVDQWAWLSWRVPPPAAILIVSYYGAWCGWVAIRERSRRLAATTLVVSCVLLWLIAWAPPWVPRSNVTSTPSLSRTGPSVGFAPRNFLTVVFLDVGQGDSTLLFLPGGRVWMVDAAGIPGSETFDVGARILAPALWRLNVRSLDVLALTHGDPDHVGGAASVASDFRPREVWEGIRTRHSPSIDRLARVAARSRATRRNVYRGHVMQVGAVTVRAWHPEPEDWERPRVRNDDSLVLSFDLGRVRLVLPGDISATVERELASEAIADASRLVILKAAHHGSAGSTSKEFLGALRPAVAIISAGTGNRFGHPAQAMLARLEESGVPALRTDLLGALAIVTDGSAAAAFSWNGRAWRSVWTAAAG